jgi:hypothetical protein
MIQPQMGKSAPQVCRCHLKNPKEEKPDCPNMYKSTIKIAA